MATMTINNKKLQEGLKIIKPFLATKNTISILSHIKVSIEDGNILTLKAQNSTMSIMVECEADEGEGAFLVPLEKIGLLKSDTIEVDGINVKSGGMKYVVGEKAMQLFDDLKSVEVENPDYKIVVEEKQMKLVYRSAEHKSTSNRFIHGFLVKSNGDVVSTDGKRLALYKTRITGENAIEAIIPIDAVKNLTGKGLLSLQKRDKSENDRRTTVDFKLEYYNKDFLVTICGAEVEGSFPPYERVIPAEEKLIHEVKGLKSDWSDKYKIFKALLDKDLKKIIIGNGRIYVENLVKGAYEEALPFDYPYEQGVNAEFLNDWFETQGDADIRLQENYTDSIVISGDKLMYVVMPMSV